ncbi:MAG: anthranilate synthase component I [Spirochaetales bacterium]
MPEHIGRRNPMVSPSLCDLEYIIAKHPCKRVPIKAELYADTVTPITALRKLKNVSHHCFMFESVEHSKQWGRYTFLGFNPTLEITARNGEVQLKTDKKTQTLTDNPAEVIRSVLAENQSISLPDFPPFAGGLVGYFSYDYIKYTEPTLVLDAQDEEGFKDVDLMLFDKLIAFDNYKQKIILIANIKTDDLAQNFAQGEQALKEMAHIVLNGEPFANKSLTIKGEFRQLFDENSYCAMVQKAKDYIHEGDIFQVVLSNRLEADIEGSLFDAYRILRTTNPSPYMFYFSSDDVEIAGASPETLVSLKNNTLHTFPLAGTKPRGKTEQEDRELEHMLLNDEKEVAEHNMLVDLGRNDIGKISKIGSVEVEKYMSIEKFSHVMHIGSTVKGILADDKDALNAVDAILPAGTLSGAPKLRACEIINELENNKRGIYGGAIGYIDFSGNLDTCIAIRLAFAKNGKVFIRSGAGIVADSVPQNEYQECINKAKAVTEALKTAEGGIDL